VSRVSQALYRRYRPETFEDVIGQEHVTLPLQQALRNDRVNHAYLFSGPRGCGKTTSARILARCLNCEKGPTPTPCGECQSCRDLARGGPGSIDVIEIDAASHGGVDDARELREKAFFAPAASPYKIYIVDEAHMVSPQGFNALLKIVEEPPPHLKFIFATTEPDKVIGTIRSRTHHYPFRLVPPGQLQAYLAELCGREGVAVERAVLPLVVRAGRGSVRDSLSVLDQLIAGAGDDGVSYALASALLGYTDATLLDDTIEACAVGDGAAVFGIVDRVIEAGHDPKRFAEDLLERLRDLIILAAVPDAASGVLGHLPDDQIERMRQQAARFGAAELSRAADIVNTGLTEMRGATAPRLQLELICARVLLPGASRDEQSLAARLDRLERRIALGAMSASAPVPERAVAAPAGPISESAPATASAPAAAASVDRPADSPSPAPVTASARRPAEATADRPTQPQPSAAAEAGALDLTSVRRMWPEVLEAVKLRRRFTWSLLSHNAQIAALDGKVLSLAMINAGARDSFTSSGSDEIVRQALIDVLGVDWKVEALVDPSRPTVATSAAGATSAPAASQSPAATSGGTPAEDTATGAAPPPGSARPRRTQPANEAGQADDEPGRSSYVAPEDDVPAADDPDLDDDGVTGADLLARELGAKVIGEYDTDR
jgi:DNA polymerase-3 subunit gamma/tau